MQEKETAIFGKAHFGRACFGIYFNLKMDKAKFVDIPDRALFGVAHFGEASFGMYSATLPPRFGYTRFGVTDPLFERLKEQFSKSLS